jgi:hypothetical protein
MRSISIDAPRKEDLRERPTDNALYRAVWRWHFYAGLLVIPFLMALAITGCIYLFDDEINASSMAT